MFGRAGRWEDLIDMHREEAEVSRVPQQRAQLLCQVAELYENKLEDQEQAASTYREVLDELPTYHPAIRALSRIAQQTGDFQGLVDTLKSELDILHDPRDRALMRCRIAELIERHLESRRDAIRMCSEAINESPGLLTAHEQLVALVAEHGEDAEEVEARERMQDVIPDIDGRVANLRALGELYLYRLEDVGKAMQSFERLLEERGDDRGARRSAIDCALRLKDYAAAIRHAEALAEVETTPDEVANLHMQVATWRESHLEPPEDPLKNHLKALEYDPMNPAAIRAVERAYVERGEWQGLFQLYDRERNGIETPSRIADLSVKMGEIADRRLEDAELAARQFEVALHATPDHLPAIGRLKEVYAKLDRPEDQMRMLAFEANASKDDDHAIKTLLEVGGLQRDKFGNAEAAIESYQQVLRRQPLHNEANKALEGLFTAEERWEDLGKLYVHRASHTTDQAQKVDLLVHAGQVALERIGARELALQAYEGVLKVDGHNVVALAQVGNLAYGMEQWERSKDAYEGLLEATEDGATRAAAYFTLGVLYGDHLQDADRAVDALKASIELAPDNKEGHKRLATAQVAAGNNPGALKSLKQLIELAGSNEERLQATLGLAEHYENNMKEVSQAAATYERALEETKDAATQAQLLERCAALYQRSGNFDGYLKVATRFATTIAEHDPARAAHMLANNAKMVLDHKQDHIGAIELAKKGLEYAPEYFELRGFLADLFSQEPEMEGLAVEEHRRILAAGIVRIPSVRSLFNAWQSAPDKRFVAAETLNFLGVANEEEEVEFAQNRKKVSSESDAYLTPDQLSQLVLHPAHRNIVHEVMNAVALELSKLDADDLTIYDVDKKSILKAKSADPLRTLADSVAYNLGGMAFDVHRSTARPHACIAHHAPTPVLMVGADLVQSYQTREQRFLLGRALVGMRCGHQIIREMSARDFGLLLSAIGRAVDKGFAPIVDSPDLDPLAKRVGSSLSRQTKKALVEPVQQLAAEVGRVDLQQYLNAIPMTENRGGLALSGSFPTAAKLYARHRGTLLATETEMLVASLEADAVLGDLFSWSLSDEHLRTRQIMGFALGG
jgi:tetratricopeptide (TPR) repeat protein